MPRKKFPLPPGDEFTPEEAAHILGRQRRWAYNEITAGRLHPIKNELGHWRITAAEIERYRTEEMKRYEAKQNNHVSPETERAIRSGRGRVAGFSRSASHTTREMSEMAKRGQHEHYARILDPDGTMARYNPGELERQIAAAIAANMARVRLERDKQRALRERFGHPA